MSDWLPTCILQNASLFREWRFQREGVTRQRLVWDSQRSEHLAHAVVCSRLICTVRQHNDVVTLQSETTVPQIAANSRKRRIQNFVMSILQRNSADRAGREFSLRKPDSVDPSDIVAPPARQVDVPGQSFASTVPAVGVYRLSMDSLVDALSANVRHPERLRPQRVNNEKRNVDQRASAGRKPDCHR